MHFPRATQAEVHIMFFIQSNFRFRCLFVSLIPGLFLDSGSHRFTTYALLGAHLPLSHDYILLFGRGITKEMLISLSDGMFVEKSENLLITGATGCGKSYLACAMGRNACLLGHRTLYYSMNRFIEALAAARLDGTYIRWLNTIAKTPLLIIDDLGLQPLSHDMKLTLLQILEDRFAKGATIVTS